MGANQHAEGVPIGTAVEAGELAVATAVAGLDEHSQNEVASPTVPAESAPEAIGTADASHFSYHREPEWLWPGYIPLDGVTVIIGTMPSAVTALTATIAATVSAGAEWPDYTRSPRGRVVWLTRHANNNCDALDAAGAYLRNVDHLHPEPDIHGMPIYEISRDLHRLHHAISTEADTRLLIVDSFALYLEP